MNATIGWNIGWTRDPTPERPGQLRKVRSDVCRYNDCWRLNVWNATLTWTWTLEEMADGEWVRRKIGDSRTRKLAQRAVSYALDDVREHRRLILGASR